MISITGVSKLKSLRSRVLESRGAWGRLLEKSEKFALRGYDHILGGRIFNTLFPAHAGVIPVGVTTLRSSSTLPRACGGDSRKTEDVVAFGGFSPRTRG